MDCQLLHQKVRQRISLIQENWHFNSFKLPKWIFWETIFEIWEDQCLFFLCFHYWDLMSNNWRFIIVIVKGLYLRLFADIFDLIIDDPFAGQNTKILFILKVSWQRLHSFAVKPKTKSCAFPRQQQLGVGS